MATLGLNDSPEDNGEDSEDHQGTATAGDTTSIATIGLNDSLEDNDEDSEDNDFDDPVEREDSDDGDGDDDETRLSALADPADADDASAAAAANMSAAAAADANLHFEEQDEDDASAREGEVHSPEPSPRAVVEVPPGTWPRHLPAPAGACEGVQVYKFYHNAYTVLAGAMYENNFLVAGVMLDDRDTEKFSAYLVMVEAANPSKGVRLKWFDPAAPPRTEYNMTRVGASRLSNNVDIQVRSWSKDEAKFQASVAAAQSIDFVIEKFVGITEEDGETLVKARFVGWTAGFDVWYALSDLEPAPFNLARTYLRENSTTPVTNGIAGARKKNKKGAKYTAAEDALLRTWAPKVCANDKNAPTWTYIAQHLLTGRSSRALVTTGLER